jgi:hypothetical protein
MAEQNKFEVEITARIDQLEGALKKAEDGINKAGKAAQSQKGQFSSLGDTLSVMNVNFGGVGVNVGAMTKQLNSVVTAIKAATLSTRAFGVALAATGIGAILLALGALIGLFKSTQQGTDAVNKVMMQLKYAFDAIVGVLQTKVLAGFEKLKKAFEDPKKAVVDLWESIKTNLLNRLVGVSDAFQILGRTISLALKGKLSEAREEASKLGETILQIATGVEDLPNKMKAFANEIGAAYENGKKVGATLADLDKKIMLYKINTTAELAKQRSILAENNRISHDEAATLEEQLAAQEKAYAALNRIKQIELGLLSLEHKRADLATTTSDTNDETKLQIQQILAAQHEVVAAIDQQGKRLDANNARLNKAKLEAEALKKALEFRADIDAIDTSAFEKFAETFESMEEEPILEKFLTADQVEEHKKMLEGIAQKYNEVSVAANVLSNSIGSVVEDGFMILFDSAKGFDDFAKVLKNAFKRIIADMAAAAAKALVLRAIMGAFTGGAGFAVAGGGGVGSFAQLFGQGMGGGGAMQIRGQDLVRLTNNAGANTIR